MSYLSFCLARIPTGPRTNPNRTTFVQPKRLSCFWHKHSLKINIRFNARNATWLYVYNTLCYYFHFLILLSVVKSYLFPLLHFKEPKGTPWIHQRISKRRVFVFLFMGQWVSYFHKYNLHFLLQHSFVIYRFSISC